MIFIGGLSLHEFMEKLISNLEQTAVSLAALEQVVFRSYPLAPGIYRTERDVQAAAQKQHFDDLRHQLSILPR
jgi:hypothetical protein